MLKEKTKVYVHSLKEIVLAPVKWVFRLFEMIVDYTGPFAIVLKGVPVAALALLIFSPFILYTWVLNIAQSTKSPISYILYMLWWVYSGLLIFGASLVGYVMETKGSSQGLPKSSGYRRQKEKKQERNLDKVVKEYLDILKKQNNNKN